MIHHEPWFTCDQCGAVLHLGPVALKQKKHFCNKWHLEIFMKLQKLKRIQEAFEAKETKTST